MSIVYVELASGGAVYRDRSKDVIAEALPTRRGEHQNNRNDLQDHKSNRDREAKSMQGRHREIEARSVTGTELDRRQRIPGVAERLAIVTIR